MQWRIGIRREDKSVWERRVPITPEDAGLLREQHGIQVYVQPSTIRAFDEEEFREAGAIVQEDPGPCRVVFGVKEMPAGFFEPGKVYVFFAHVIKGQPHNMLMLRRILEQGCTLIDYERIMDDQGRRLIFFGRFAGIAGAIETLWALGQRLAWEGIANPLTRLRHAYEYRDLATARQAVSEVGQAIFADGLPAQAWPLVIGVVGYGNVARGAWEILDLLPIQRISPAEIAGLDPDKEAIRNAIHVATFREEDTVAPRMPGQRFELQDYYERPERYVGCFERHLPNLTAVLNCIYWSPRSPRLVTRDYLRQAYGPRDFRLRVIGDISCDIEGAIECTLHATDPGQPVFVYRPLTGEVTDGYAGEGVVVMAVDILPSELPRDSSTEFSRVLTRFVPEIACADYTVPFGRLDLPAEIKPAVIAYRGDLAPDYRYLKEHMP